MRSGLIRKDLLPQYARQYMPETVVIRSFQDAEPVLSTFPRWIVKYTDSSNAYGIQILDNTNVQAFQQLFDPTYVRTYR